MTCALKIENLRKTYDGKKYAVDGISLEIEEGKLILLVGENGAGKTTLFNLLVDQLKATEGSDLYNMNVLPRGFKSISYCTQLLSIDWYLSVFDNVMLGAYFNSKNLKEAKAKTRESLELLRLTEYSNHSVETLSGGQQQRVQIARALAADPTILFLDEPIVGLDNESSIEVMNKLRSLSKQNNVTIIISSHQLSLVENFCDEMILLREGKVVEHTALNVFKDNYKNIGKLSLEFENEIEFEKLETISENILYCKNGKTVEILHTGELVDLIVKEFGSNLKQIKKVDISLDDILLLRKRHHNGTI